MPRVHDCQLLYTRLPACDTLLLVYAAHTAKTGALKMATELEDLEFKKLRVETRKMLADMEHDMAQRHHWDETRKTQEDHSKRQQQYWLGTVVVAVIALIVTGFVAILKG